MIRPLRRAHLRIVIALSVLLPAVIVAALLVRPVPVKMTPLPEEGRVLPLTMFKRWDEAGVYVRFERARKESERAVMAVVPITEFYEPDVLIYWNPPANVASMPGEGSILIGSLKSRQTRWFNLPSSIPESGGSLAVYSLTRERVIRSGAWQISYSD